MITRNGCSTLEVRAAEAPLAVVDGVAIGAEVEKPIAAQLGKLKEQIYNLRRSTSRCAHQRKLMAREAAKRGISVPALLDAEVTFKVGLVTEQEIEKFYHANKAQLQGEESKLREQIRAHRQPKARSRAPGV